MEDGLREIPGGRRGRVLMIVNILTKQYRVQRDNCGNITIFVTTCALLRYMYCSYCFYCSLLLLLLLLP